MKLVIEYDTGDGECDSNNCVECTNYESAEAFMCDFEKLFRITLSKSPYDCFTLANLSFFANDFIHKVYDKKGNVKLEIILPDVYELNEWFEAKLN